MMALEAANPLTLQEFGVILLVGATMALWLWVKEQEDKDD